ncbi:hypothetical protein TMEN_6475 [Trichophyton mentagrophytes]|uniref:Uncharacterized protein n=2 Tax=Trichophyton TaxID=5550 RepID=A0A059J5V6_TRIIM|nr:hypothetical protein TEQG_07094 [Trichophyton equinum CBS 127.97]EZF31283.1 hypothetical protein H101_05095 [Trichophyton interdigitale H6]KDB23246.1 hypothetical protein H109_04844 [Trichophyton interdigitale MR816]GBF63814.1 hypothetical protein TMEN_6475 [Trichophyton mentagrophytes]
MARAMVESLQSLEKWVTSASSRMIKLAKGNGTPGTRAAPTQSGNNDASIGSRLDVGDAFTRDGKEYRRYHWQLNRNAANSTIRQKAQKDSHKVWSFADVEIKQNPTTDDAKDTAQKLFGDLKDNMNE